VCSKPGTAEVISETFSDWDFIACLACTHAHTHHIVLCLERRHEDISKNGDIDPRVLNLCSIRRFMISFTVALSLGADPLVPMGQEAGWTHSWFGRGSEKNDIPAYAANRTPVV